LTLTPKLLYGMEIAQEDNLVDIDCAEERSSQIYNPNDVKQAVNSFLHSGRAVLELDPVLIGIALGWSSVVIESLDQSVEQRRSSDCCPATLRG